MKGGVNMNFKAWVLNHVKESTPRGDLARDIRADKTFPENYTEPDQIEAYIRSRNVTVDSSEACKVFRRVWNQYVKADSQ